MPFSNHFLNVSILPHAFSRLSPDVKSEYKKKYVIVKRYSSVAALTGVGVAEGLELTKDIINSKLKAYGYKSLFAIASGPLIQFISIPIYVFSFGSRFRRFAVATSEIGAKISSGEMTIVNWAWLGIDLILFGEPVSITDDMHLMVFKNETVGEICNILEGVGGGDE